MDTFFFTKAVAAFIVAFWVIVLVRWLRNPSSIPEMPSTFPVHLTQRQTVAIAVAGIVAGVLVLVYLFVAFPA